jgi:hypothetical protein
VGCYRSNCQRLPLFDRYLDVHFGSRVVPEKKREREKDKRMSLWILLLIVGAWIVLQAYILPKFGIST